MSENSHPVALGDDIWNTVAAIRPQRMVFTDSFAGQVLVIGVLEMRAHQPFIYTIRLKIEHRRISESETMVTSERIAGQHFKPEEAASFAPLLQQNVSAAGRETRDTLLADAR